MRKILVVFVVIILFLALVSWYNASPRVIISRLIKNDNTEIGQLRYKIYLLKIFPVGDAILGTPQLAEYKGQKVYRLTASANNSRLFSKFFNASATLESYIDMQQFNPMLFKQKLIVTGKPDLYREVLYDQAKGVMSIAGVRRQIYSNTQDPLSAIFNVRRMDFGKTQSLELGINTNQKNYILKGTAKTKSISIGRKTYNIAFLEANISRRDKNPYHKSSISMVFLREKGNLPVSINVFARGILINARLIDIK